MAAAARVADFEASIRDRQQAIVTPIEIGENHSATLDNRPLTRKLDVHFGISRGLVFTEPQIIAVLVSMKNESSIDYQVSDIRLFLGGLPFVAADRLHEGGEIPFAKPGEVLPVPAHEVVTRMVEFRVGAQLFGSPKTADLSILLSNVGELRFELELQYMVPNLTSGRSPERSLHRR